MVLAWTPSGSPRSSSDEVEIMDRMDRDLDLASGLQKGEQTPRRIDREMDLDIDETPQKSVVERVLDRQHLVRREAKLEIDRRD